MPTAILGPPLPTPTCGEPPGHDGARRVLVVVDDARTTPGLCASVRAHVGDRPIEALVLAPAHRTAATQWYADEDAACADVAHRLRACVARLAGDGIRATGTLGRPDPVEAIADALDGFDADEILLVTAPRRPPCWLRSNVVDRAHEAFRQPIAHVVMPAG